ncbi:MAG: type II toxin-antitoxin system PemK/MazF family toxin [Proteobacteria bacterium]|nr:type II toxin-antitoxin system PemK/MazF family toxin [Pseudomonadota bacterium]
MRPQKPRKAPTIYLWARSIGVVLCDQTRTIDARARSYRRVEKASAALVAEALDALRAILE